MKATEQYFPVVLFITLYTEVVLISIGATYHYIKEFSFILIYEHVREWKCFKGGESHSFNFTKMILKLRSRILQTC